MSLPLPLFPLNVVLFPGMTLPLHIFEPRYREMISTCVAASRPFGVVLIQAGEEVGAAATPHPVGTAAHITSVKQLPDGRLNIEAVGFERFRIVALHDDQTYLTGTVETFPLANAAGLPAQRAAQALAPLVRRYLELLSAAAATHFEPSALPDQPESLAYLAAIVAQIPMLEKQALLAAPDAVELLDREQALLRREISLVRAMLARPHADDATTFSPN